MKRLESECGQCGWCGDRALCTAVNCWAPDAILDPMVICLLEVESNSKIDPEGQGKGNRGVSKGHGQALPPIAILYGGLASSWMSFSPRGWESRESYECTLKEVIRCHCTVNESEDILKFSCERMTAYNTKEFSQIIFTINWI